MEESKTEAESKTETESKTEAESKTAEESKTVWRLVSGKESIQKESSVC